LDLEPEGGVDLPLMITATNLHRSVDLLDIESSLWLSPNGWVWVISSGTSPPVQFAE
jgi:hypothetical protein